MEVLSVAVALAALAVSVYAIRFARRSADSAEESATAAQNQARESERANELNQVAALRQAQEEAYKQVPRVTVAIDPEQVRTPCVLLRDADEEKEGLPLPERLHPIREHRLDFLGKWFRGTLRNDDSRRILIEASPSLFIEGKPSHRDVTLHIPDTIEPGTFVLDPGGEALFEWFGRCTVIDWYEIARNPGTGVQVPWTDMQITAAGEGGIPQLVIKLTFDRPPVYLMDFVDDEEAARHLAFLGGDGGSIRCDVQRRYPRVPETFDMISRLAHLY